MGKSIALATTGAANSRGTAASRPEQRADDGVVGKRRNGRRGNEELRKTIKVGASARWYVFVLMMTASALLLFFDWFNS